LFFFFAFLFSCNNDEFESKSESVESQKTLTFDKEHNILIFKGSRKSFSEFIENEKEDSESKTLMKFYNDGFDPFSFSKNIEPEKLEKIKSYKAKLASSNEEDEDYDEDEESFIKNDAFRNLLNDKGEIQVNDSIYRYTEKGIFMSHQKDHDYLVNYMNENWDKLNIGFGLNHVNDKIKSYKPDRSEFDKFQVTMPDKLDIQGKTYSKTVIPETNFDFCNPRKPFLDNIIGTSYACVYRFNRRNKVRVVFDVSDYYLFFDVFAQAKFKRRRTFWFSSRAASLVYLKINDFSLQTGRKEVNIPLTGKQKDIVNAYNKYINGHQNHLSGIPVVTRQEELLSDNGGVKITDYYLNHTDLSRNSPHTVVPANKSIISDFGFNFRDFFGDNVKKVAYVTVLGKNNISFTNQELLRYAHDAVKGLKPKGDEPTGVVLTLAKFEENQLKSQALNYYVFNEEHSSERNAIVKRKFNIKKNFDFSRTTIGFETNGSFDGNNKYTLNLHLKYNVIRSYSIDLEGGALYGGHWGGSKFKVVKN